jgi:CO/xanthine dehydrogenase FAD-binding subunit
MIRDFAYHKASTMQEALDFLEEHKEDNKIICGGQSLLILMRQGLIAPGNLIDIKNLKELSFIDFDPEKGLRIGATTTHRTVEKSSLVLEHFPLLVEMEENLASVQTRNWGTIGGNLAHADPTGDPGPVFMALNARVKAANKKRERMIPLEGFFVDYFETVLEEDELLLEVQVPLIPPRTSVAYDKFNIIRNDQGIVSVAASITASEDKLTCQDARIILGAAAATPLRAKEAEKILIGQKIGEDVIEEAGQKASEESEPVRDIHASEEYRRLLVKVLTKRMVKKAWDRSRNSF